MFKKKTERIKIGSGIAPPGPELIVRGVLPDLDGKTKLQYPDASFVRVRIGRDIHYLDLDSLFMEVSRVLRNGGLFEIDVPHLCSFDAFEIWGGHFFSEKWFRENIVFNRYFEILNIEYIYSELFKFAPWWLKFLPRFFLKRFFMNVFSHIKIQSKLRPN